MGLRRIFRPDGLLRPIVDAIWVVAFVVLASVVAYRNQSSGGPSRGGVALELKPMEQRRGVYRGSQRLGEVQHKVSRAGAGWRISQRYVAGAGTRAVEVGWSHTVLRADLSLDRLSVSVEPARLAGLLGLGASFAAQLNAARLRLRGSCNLETGRCQLNGSLGKRKIAEDIVAGRGPVVPSAVLPLLARGVLGNKAELGIFNPLSMQRQVVTFRIVGRGSLRLGGAAFPAIELRQNVQGLETGLWIDAEGRLLREDLPLGVSIVHEAWLSGGGGGNG